jgi:hypothetical protein
VALTQEQWFQKLKKFLPKWFFEEENYQKAHIYGVAKVLEALQANAQEHVLATFVMDAEDEELDQHGYERGVTRLSGETDAQYAPRVQSLRNRSNRPSIQDLIDSLLAVGEATLLRDEDEGYLYCDNEYFADRDCILVTITYNSFSIIVDNQAQSDSFYDVISEAVNTTHAFGTGWRFIEREA